MSDVFRFTVTRASQRLEKCQSKSIGIPAYPKNSQSQLIERLKILCQTGNKEEYIKYLQAFLEGNQFIHSLTQINPFYASAYEWILCNRRNATTASFYQTLQIRNTKERDRFLAQIHEDRIRVADSLISLSILGLSGRTHSLNYQNLVLAGQLIEIANYPRPKGRKVTEYEIKKMLSYPIILPEGVINIRCCEHNKDPRPNGVDYGQSWLIKKTSTSLTRNVQEPTKDECNCCEEEICVEPSFDCICIKPFVTDLLVVREELNCYEAGEIAYIENILIGEKRVRKHRNLLRTEDFSETETTKTSSEEKDHQVSERFDLQNESQSIIKTDASIDAGLTVSGSYGPNVSMSASVDVSSSISKEVAQRTASNYSREVVDRSVMKIQETVRQLVSKKIIHEIEENNKHSFDNVGGSNHISGHYHWVNKTSKAQVMSYGKRMAYDLIVPEPSENYKHLLSKRELASLPSNIKDPGSFSLNANDISEDPSNGNYYLALADLYGGISGLDAPPPREIWLSASLVSEVQKKYATGEAEQMQTTITVPANYLAVHCVPQIGAVWNIRAESDEDNNRSQQRVVRLAAGSLLFVCDYPNSHFNGGGQNFPGGFSGAIGMSMSHYGGEALAITVSVKCERTKESYSKWQLEVFEKIMAAYQIKKAEYEAAILNKEAKDVEKIVYGRNPFLNREIERTELKKLVISILMCQHFDDFNAMKRKVKPCGYPQLDFKDAEEEGKIIKFFEQAVEWNFMTYKFYEYMWGKKCYWHEKIQEATNDPLFDKFLMAGAARVQITIRPEFEDYFNWYMATGEIWGQDGTPPIPGDPHYVSIIQEIKEQKQCYYTDRDGELTVTDGNDEVLLDNSGYYWDYLNGQVDLLLRDNDIDREIVIECVVYRIVAITQNGSPTKWKIKLERAYDIKNEPIGTIRSHLKFQVGALFIGAPWLVKTPTNLVYLRTEKDCLPCFPLPKLPNCQ